MSTLAYNLNGEPFELPPSMAGWRVRKLKLKGAPEPVPGRDGLPLFLALDADIEDLRREAREPGRYRLDPVDEHNRAILNATAAYVWVHAIERVPEPPAPATVATAPAAEQTDITAALVAALLESQKQHTELARMYVSQFPVVANAMAGVVRSASDAGLTTRVPLVLPVAPEPKSDDTSQRDDENDSDENDEQIDEEIESDQAAVEVVPQPAYSWARVAQTLADQVSPHVGPLLAGLPGLATMLGAKRAPTASDATRGPDQTDPAPAEAEPRAPSAPVTGFDAGMLVRINAIKAQLTPVERQFAQTLLDEIPAEDLPLWFDRLRAMSVDEAAAYVREMFREGQAAASARPAAPPTARPPSPPSAMPRSAPPPAAGTTAKRPTRKTTPSNGLALLDDATQAHLAAIDAALTFDEAAALRKQFAALAPRDRASWVATLVMLPAGDAVAAIRAQLAATDAAVQAPHGVSTSNAPQVPAVASTLAVRDPAAPTPHGASSGGAPEDAPRNALQASTPSTDRTTLRVVAAAPLAETTIARAEPEPVAAERDANRHLAEIENALTDEERVRMHAMFAKAPPDEREVWLDRLLSVPPAQGTTILREALGETTRQPPLTEPQSASVPTTLEAAGSGGHATASPNVEAVSQPYEPTIDEIDLENESAMVDADDLAGAELLDPAALIARRAAQSTPEMDAGKHFQAIDSALTLAEKMRAYELAAQRPLAGLRCWYADLLRLSVPDAVAKIRAELATGDGDPTATKKGGVS